MRVLVVEDEKKTASFVRKALQAESFAVDVLANGDDALLAAARMPSSSTSCCRDATA
jgi:DNA-binding response OmpR family regulator